MAHPVSCLRTQWQTPEGYRRNTHYPAPSDNILKPLMELRAPREKPGPGSDDLYTVQEPRRTDNYTARRFVVCKPSSM